MDGEISVEAVPLREKTEPVRKRGMKGWHRWRLK
jgi:hypothetical protein